MAISGDEIRETAEQNRLKFGELFALLDDLSELTLCYVKSLDQPSSDVRKIYPTALLLRVWTASQAIRSLLRDGFNDDAFAGVRTMLEIEFQLSAISKKPELTKQLVRENEHYRGRRLQNLLKHKIKLPDEFQESEVEVEIQRIEAEQKALGAKPLTKREIAKVGECLTDFETIYSYLSDIDHVSPMGLAEYVSVDSLSKVATLRYGTAPLPMQYAFLWNSSILLRCLALVSTIIQKDPPGTFGELAGRHDKLWDKYVVSSNSAS